MTTLYVTEYSGFPTMSVVAAPPVSSIVADWSTAITASSTQGQAFQNATRVIQVACDTTCSIAFGANPTAVTTAHRLAANETRFYIVAGGQKIAVIANE